MATYKAGKDTTITINDVVRGFVDGSYNTGTETDDMSNTAEAGFTRRVPTLKEATVDGTIAYDADVPLDFDEQDEIDLEIANPGSPGLTGTFLVLRMGYPHMSPRSGLKVGVSLVSQGTYVKTNPEPPPEALMAARTRGGRRDGRPKSMRQRAAKGKATRKAEPAKAEVGSEGSAA